MKKRILISLITGLFCWSVSAQTADDWVNQGRSNLAAHNITAANTNFARALAVNPNHQTANALYAITRILVLPNQPAGSNFLTRIGFPVAGRNIYAWDSFPPQDTNGLWLAPSGVNADEFTAQLRTNFLPAIFGAINNLTAVTHTNFTVSLTSSETTIANVTVDYGDLKLIQAGLYASEYFIYTLNAENLDAQLTAIRALYTNGILSAQQVLTAYPQMFTFSTTNDLLAARAAFTNAVSTYMMASAFIRSRPTNEVRLVNYDPGSSLSEGNFRLVLQDLKNSLEIGPQIFALNPNLMVDLSPQFDGSLNLRSLLPRFDGNAIELGSLPDLTLDGLVYGLTQEDAESYLGNYVTMLPVGSAPQLLAGNKLNLAFTTLREHNYVLEASTNLVNWQIVTVFTAVGATSALVDSQPPQLKSRFYRLRDDTGFMAFSGVVLDYNTRQPIAGAQIYSVWDGTKTFTDANGQFYLKTSLSASMYDDKLEISAPGYSKVDSFYYGNGLNSGLQIYLAPPPANDNFANRTALTGSNVSTNGNNFGATWENGEPDDGGYSAFGNYSKSVWFTWTAPATGSYTISVSTTNVYRPILAAYTGAQLSSLTQITDIIGVGYHASYIITVAVGESFQIEIDDYRQIGGAYTLRIAP
jgi:hypothetical protein